MAGELLSIKLSVHTSRSTYGMDANLFPFVSQHTCKSLKNWIELSFDSSSERRKLVRFAAMKRRVVTLFNRASYNDGN